MCYVYVGTRFVSQGEESFSETFVGRPLDLVFEQMLPFVTGAVRDFITETEDEDVIDMTYIGEVEKDEDFYNKVELIKGLSANEVIEALPKQDIVTIYANLYDDEETIVVTGYDENGREKEVVLTNEHT
jgi:hypothetical protein